MKHLSAIVSVVFAVLTLALVALLMQEKRKGDELASQLTQTQELVTEMEADNSGLEKANDDLREQIDTLRKAPPMFTLQDVEEEPEREEVEVVESESVDFSPEAPAQSAQQAQPEQRREPTPEELAAREERERQRQEWRERRDQQRAAFRERIGGELAMRRDFFSQVPLEGLAPEYREANQKLLATFDEMQSTMEELNNQELDRNERRTLSREVWAKAREASGLMDMQRDILMNDYAQQNLGLNAEQTQGFMEYMETINEMTSMRSAFRGNSTRGNGGGGAGGQGQR